MILDKNIFGIEPVKKTEMVVSLYSAGVTWFNDTLDRIKQANLLSKPPERTPLPDLPMLGVKVNSQMSTLADICEVLVKKSISGS